MSEHDVPAERGRDELRERLATTLATPLGVQVNRAIAKAEAALASQETREPDGWAIRMRDGSWRSTIYEDRETAERKAVKAREFFAGRGNEEDNEFDSIDVLPVYLGAPAKATTCPCGGGPGHGDAWCGDYECPTCGRGPKQEEAIFQAGVERGRAGADAAVREALAVLRKNREGWLNAVELRLLPRQHEHTARALADESFAATLKLERLLAAPGAPGAGE